MGIKSGHIIGVDGAGSNKVYTLLMSSYDSETCKWDFSLGRVPYKTLLTAMVQKKTEISNATTDGREIKGVHASLDRFIPKVSIGIKPMVILSELRSSDDSERLLGYRVATSDGKVKKIKLAELIGYCSRVYSLAKTANSDAVPIQNAIFVPAKSDIASHIKSYVANQFFVEKIKITAPANVSPAAVPVRKEAIRQLSKLEELFTADQIEELKLGKLHKVDYKLYGNNKLTSAQMKEIRISLEDNVDPKLFNDPAFKPEAMRAYRIQLKYGVDIGMFVHPEYTSGQILELSTAYLNGIDISKLADPKKSVWDMCKERIELETEQWSEDDVRLFD